MLKKNFASLSKVRFSREKSRVFSYSLINYLIEIEPLFSKVFLLNIFRQVFRNNPLLKSQSNFRNVSVVDSALESKLLTSASSGISKSLTLAIFNISNKTFADETIYFTSFEFISMTKNVNFVVQAVIDRFMNAMFGKVQNMINQIRRQSSSVLFNFENDNATNNSGFTSRFLSKKLDFFDSVYESKTTFMKKSMKNISEEIIYHNVHVFVNKIKNFVVIFEFELIRINLYRCLRENVLA